MLLYWGMFTIGFMFGAVFSFATFAAKKPEEDQEYAPQTPSQKPATFMLISEKILSTKSSNPNSPTPENFPEELTN